MLFHQKKIFFSWKFLHNKEENNWKVVKVLFKDNCLFWFQAGYLDSLAMLLGDQRPGTAPYSASSPCQVYPARFILHILEAQRPRQLRTGPASRCNHPRPGAFSSFFPSFFLAFFFYLRSKGRDKDLIHRFTSQTPHMSSQNHRNLEHHRQPPREPPQDRGWKRSSSQTASLWSGCRVPSGV